MGTNENVLTIARRLTRFEYRVLDPWELAEAKDANKDTFGSMTKGNEYALRVIPEDVLAFLRELADNVILSDRDGKALKRLLADVEALALEKQEVLR